MRWLLTTPLNIMRVLSRNHAVHFGEHTRPRVCRLAPPPVGSQFCCRPNGQARAITHCVPRGRGTPHAGARALPFSIAWLRLSSLLCLALFVGPIMRAAGADVPVPANNPAAGVTNKNPEAGKPGGDFIVGISPFLDAGVKDEVFRSIVRLVVEDLPLNSKLEIYDAYHLKSITRLSIPGAKV